MTPEQRPRLPIGIAAAVMLVLVALLLGGALLFLRRESASVGPEPIAAATAARPVTPPPTPSVLAPSTPAATAAAVPAPAATTLPTAAVRPTAAQAPQVAPTQSGAPTAEIIGTPIQVTYVRVNGTVVVLLPGTPTPQIPWYQQRGAAPEPARSALLAGYEHFWNVRAQALYALDERAMSEVMTGDPLRDELMVMREWRAARQAQRVDVDHNITVLWATSDDGAVMDTLADRSVIVDTDPTPGPDTEPSEPTPAPTAVSPRPYRMAYLLKRSGEAWQVVDSIRIIQ